MELCLPLIHWPELKGEGRPAFILMKVELKLLGMARVRDPDVLEAYDLFIVKNMLAGYLSLSNRPYYLPQPVATML